MTRRMLMIVSEQPMANLLAACEPKLDVGEVHLIVSGEMQASGVGDRLADVLEKRKLACRWHSVSEPFQPEPTRNCAARLLADRPESWIVNLTGGTKPMAIGAYRAALDGGVRDIIYLDHDQGLLRWMDSNREPLPTSARFTVEEIAQAHGYRTKLRNWPSPARLAFAQHLFATLDDDARREWHCLMTDVEKKCRKRRNWLPAPIPVKPSQAVAEMLHEACRLQMCKFNGRDLIIDDPDDHQFMAGGWFEVVVAEALRELLGASQDDIRIAIEVSSPDKAENEIDVATIIDRQLVLIECKAGGNWLQDKPANTAYKLEHHKRLGGRTTRLVLAAIAPFNDNARARMRDAGIVVADGLAPDNIVERLAEACRI